MFLFRPFVHRGLLSFPTRRSSDLTGAGRDQRLSASTNERRLYVAVRGGPPGLAVVRVSTTLAAVRSEEHTSELQSRENLVCRLLLEKNKHKSLKTHLREQER